MSLEHIHPIYSQDATVYLVSGDDKEATFLSAVERSGFMQHFLDVYESSGKEKADFSVAIKPNIMTASEYAPDSPVYTDPQLVELLIAQMRAEGFSRFHVVETQNVYNYSYQGRKVALVAEMCGYSADGYEIVDLGDDTVMVDYGGVLGEHPAGRIWAEADYRISFAKNKSHWQCFYTACIKNVYGCLPQWDKMHHYHGKRREFFEAAVLIADKFSVHFGFLDAWVSGDGLSGHVRDSNPNLTRTFFASENIYALDWVAGEKMQIDPVYNYVIQEALFRWGTINIRREGNMTPWEPWTNISALLVLTLNLFEEFYNVSRFMSRAMASRMDRRFPPTSRFQWFFAITQRLTAMLELFLDRASRVQRKPPL